MMAIMALTVFAAALWMYRRYSNENPEMQGQTRTQSPNAQRGDIESGRTSEKVRRIMLDIVQRRVSLEKDGTPYVPLSNGVGRLLVKNGNWMIYVRMRPQEGKDALNRRMRSVGESFMNLAYKYRDSLYMAVFVADDENTVQWAIDNLGVSEVPSIVALCNGQQIGQLEDTDELSDESMGKFIVKTFSD
jgi:hypothetical protein